ncbi:Transposon Tf2-9 poly, partial [Paramuricea clavata]
TLTCMHATRTIACPLQVYILENNIYDRMTRDHSAYAKFDASFQTHLYNFTKSAEPQLKAIFDMSLKRVISIYVCKLKTLLAYLCMVFLQNTKDVIQSIFACISILFRPVAEGGVVDGHTMINEGKGLKENFEVLDNYFVPKVNVPFERHLFRQMCQVAGETVDQFVCRLRKKALTYEFADVDETIRDQLIEKCRNVKLRRTFLEKINVSLKNLQDIARAHEAVEIQMRSLEQSDSQQSEDGQLEIRGKIIEKTEQAIIKGAGKPLLGKSTAEKLKVLHVGPFYGAQVCSTAMEGSDTDIRKEYADTFVGVGKLKNYQLKLHINKDVKPVAQGIELEEQSRDITTFVTHRGLYRYKRLMFGITSAPEKYQKIISDVIQGCNGVANIADDLIVYGCDLQEHDRNLHAVLQRLRDSGMTLNGDKCQFRLPKLTFFGHELSNQGVTPSEEKIAAVVNARAPRNTSEVRSFVQLVQYSSKFIPNFSQEAEPLRKLLRKEHSFKAFEKLKQLMSTSKALAYFWNECKTRIVADAGPEGLGAVLLQLLGEEWRAVSYASRNLTEVERRYAQTEKEALALVWACERFNLYVYGREFELETDHKPLQCIFGKSSKPSARIERWVLRLQCHHYNVVYRPGNTNIADALSRLNQPKPKDLSRETEEVIRLVVQERTPVALTPREIERKSDKDPELSSVRHYIETGDWSHCKMPSYLCVKNELCVIGKLLLRGDRIVIPQSLREKVLKSAHEGQQGIVKTKGLLRTKMLMLRKCANRVVDAKLRGNSVLEPMMRTEPPMRPWQDIAIDLMGPIPTGESLLVTVDYYSRFYEVVVMRSETTQRVIAALSDIFARFGFPHSLESDNCPQFVSEEFRRYLRENGIEHRKSPPLWPLANGEVERQNGTLLKTLKVAKAEGKKWQEELPKFLLAYRSTPQVNTGATPAYLMFGRELKTKLPELRRQDSILNQAIKEHDWSQKLNQKAYADYKNKASTNPVAPGDQVLLKNTKTTEKLAPNYENEPYTVVTKEGHQLMLQSKDGEVYRTDSSFVKPSWIFPKYGRPKLGRVDDFWKQATKILCLKSKKKSNKIRQSSEIYSLQGPWLQDSENARNAVLELQKSLKFKFQ